MTPPGRILHVFPYDPRHLGQGFERWAASQIERWPLAAVGRSRFAASSSAHVIGPRRRRIPAPPVEIIEHPSVASGPRWRDWGDDWSVGLERALGRLGPGDVCVIHSNDYTSARLAQRAARHARVVIVFHGRGLGRFDEHLASADRLVVLREDAAEELVAAGARREQVALLPPSVDRSRFFPDHGSAGSDELKLGFVGRLEASKGIFEIPPLLARLTEDGGAARAEIAGSYNARQRDELIAAAARVGVQDRIELLGEIAGEELAQLMRTWRLLLLPSHTEGHPLVALEACACRLPVAAVEHVLPRELERRPAVSLAPRERYAELVRRLLHEDRRPPPDDWVRDHHAGAAEWDALLEGLPAWSVRPRPQVSRLRRVRRLRPPRQLARIVLRRERLG